MGDARAYSGASSRYFGNHSISLAVPKFAFCGGLYKYLQTEACRLLFSENTELRRRRERRKNRLRVVGRLAKGAKALVVSELIAIFLVPLSTSLSSIRSFWQFFFILVALWKGSKVSVWLQVEAVEVGWLQAEAVEVGWLQAEQ